MTNKLTQQTQNSVNAMEANIQRQTTRIAEFPEHIKYKYRQTILCKLQADGIDVNDVERAEECLAYLVLPSFGIAVYRQLICQID